MDPFAVPPRVAAALLAAGYRAGGPAGVGGGGPVWSAVGPADGSVPGERVVVQTVPIPAGPDGDRAARRVEALCGLDHPHLARVVDVLDLSDDAEAGREWAVLLAEVPGATVAALLAARGRLSAAEVVTLTVPLAGALDALHRAGVVHGDVSPANVVVRPDGRPVLIDLLGAPAVRGSRQPRGTPGFVAPEVLAGTVRDGVRRAGSRSGERAASSGDAPPAERLPDAAPVDVFALAAVALAALDLAATDGPLGRELAAACAPDPATRPTAADLAAACYGCAEPVPITLPDAGVLARTALAQLAGAQRTVSAGTRSRHRAARRSRRPWPSRSADAIRRSDVDPSAGDRSGRPRRAAPWRALTVAAAAGAAVLAAMTVAPDLVARPPAGIDVGRGDSGARATSPAGGTARPDPVDAAVRLTHRRAEVLAAGDPTLLADVTRVGSRAYAADLAVLERLASEGVSLDGLAATVADAELRASGVQGTGPPSMPPGAGNAAPAAAASVAVTSGLTGHRRVSGAGSRDVPAEPARTVVLDLVWTDDGWRVEDVGAP